MERKSTLVTVDHLIENDKEIDLNDKSFEKLMFVYATAMKELETKIEILKDEFKIFYNYNLVDHINTRIKTPQSIVKKMKKKDSDMTYQGMIENINDIAGIRVICPLQKDIFTVKNLIGNLSGIHVLTEKDYVTNPKKSGYASYHQIVEVPVNLSQKVIYVKAEVQVRTMAMDFWASLEHEMKYKSEQEIDKASSKELISCAKMIHKLDQKMTVLKS